MRLPEQENEPTSVIPGRMLWSIHATLTISFLFVACAGASPNDQVDSSIGVPSQDTRGAADGTLRVGERVFELKLLTACNLSEAEIESPDEMIRGIGTTGEGTRFSVVVDRILVGAGLVHSVGVTYGDVMGGRGYRAEAVRTRLAGGWTDEVGPFNEPLIVIEGRTVRAEGRFKVDSAGVQSVADGGFEVTCPA